jgi:copper homeostasis protein CutC
MMNTIRLIIALAVAAVLAGCATTNGTTQGPTLQEVRDTACPVIEGVVMGLLVDPAIDEKTWAKLKAAQPAIEAACSYNGTAEDLRALTQVAFQQILDYIAAANLTPEQKQTAILGLTTAKLVILNYRPPKVE